MEVEIGGVAICRPFGKFRRANSYCHLYGAQSQRQAYFQPLATMNFVDLDLTTSDRTIYLDALKAASSGGSISLFSKLVAKGEIRKTDAFLWMTLLPFTSYLDEESVAATLPLLKKNTAIRQGLLGVSAMTYKYCSTRNDCENSNAVKSVSSSLKQFLGDKCQATNKEEEAKPLKKTARLHQNKSKIG
ncbi:vitellogenin [Trichonephila clavipes]|nr:vitellogenin [Trichonephila clavipes]